MGIETSFVMLFAVASAVALLAKRFRLPYTVALVAAGLLLGLGDPFEPPHLTKELLYAVFLPGLLFEAAFHLELKNFWDNKIAIHTLAVPGVIVAIVISAGILMPFVEALELEAEFRFIDALVFGGLVAATDPIAVVSLFKSLGAPKRLGVLVEGESLFNDGTAVVLFGIIVAVATGAEITAGSAIVEFVKTVGLGLLIGGGVGFGVSKIIQRVDDAMIEMTLTTIAAYGSFVFAEQFHVSGVMATVVAGLICGNYAARTGMSASTTVAVGTFWEYVAFALNSVVFLLIGFEVQMGALLAAWLPIVVAWAAVLVARALVVGSVTALLSRTREKIPLRWAGVLVWGGLRGGLSMVLVLALPLDFPHRPFLLNLTFGVVLLSILVQGVTMGPLLRWLGVISTREERMSYEAARAGMLCARAALDELDKMATEHTVAQPAIAQLRTEYQERSTQAEERVKGLQLAHVDIPKEELRNAKRHLLLVEKERVLKEIHAGLLSSEAASPLLSDIDARLLALEETSDEIPS